MIATEIIGETDARSEIQPALLNEARGDAAFAGNSDAVQIELCAGRGEDGVGAAADAGAIRSNCVVSAAWLEDRRIRWLYS